MTMAKMLDELHHQGKEHGFDISYDGDGKFDDLTDEVERLIKDETTPAIARKPTTKMPPIHPVTFHQLRMPARSNLSPAARTDRLKRSPKKLLKLKF